MEEDWGHEGLETRQGRDGSPHIDETVARKRRKVEGNEEPARGGFFEEEQEPSSPCEASGVWF